MDKKSRDLVMGKLYLKNKDYKMAEKSLIDYLNSSPEDFPALKMLAQVYENLNNQERAFEFYERAYLVEPERKGTLLDICRLLIAENSGLEHVDRKKWLKLAVQTFPSNPIVTNLRDTLPKLQHNPVPSKIDIESQLLSKLESLEQRLTGIESALAKLTVNASEVKVSGVSSAPQAPQNTQAPQVTQAPSMPQVSQVAPAPTMPLATSTAAPIAQTTPAPQLQQAPKVQPAPQVQPTALSQSIFQSLQTQSTPQSQPLSLTKPTTPKAPTLTNSLSQPATTAAPAAQTPKAPVPLFPSLNPLSSFASLVPKASEDSQPKETTPQATPAATTKTEEAPLTFSFGLKTGTTGNFWGESLKKYNLPTEGSWTTATPPAPKQEPAKGEESDGDDGVVEAPELPIENTCDMKPIEIKSGEEDEDIIFEHRCKLFRFRDKEYKERGLGNIKVLKHRDNGAGRLIMRRDLINLVCLNCWSLSKIERVRDTQVRFAGLDASDGEPTLTVFLAKFKTPELTDTFMSHLTKLFPDEANE